jgi:3-oxoacyl-[acyl-carrier protein] reductase
MNFDGQSAIVTGGAQGIGRAVTERLLEDGAAGVAIWDRDEALARRTADELAGFGAVHVVPVDVTDLGAVEAAFAATLEALGSVEILVCNAGIAGPNAPTWEYDPAAWDRIMALNLNGVFYCCRTVVPHMIEAGYGRIVNIASVAGKEGNPGASAYSASKAAVIALTKSLGKELAAHDIAVNCITPSAAKTAIFDQMSQQHIDFMLSKVPRGRFVRVEEIAAIVAFAASRDCTFTTGAAFDISGGRATY